MTVLKTIEIGKTIYSNLKNGYKYTVHKYNNVVGIV